MSLVKYGLIHRDTTYQTSVPNAGTAGGQNLTDRPLDSRNDVF